MEEEEGEADESLARRVQDGDRAALERLVRRYVRPVHAVVASFLSEPAEIEDAAQEAFLRALGALDTYDPRRPFAPWLYQVARNVARNQVGSRAVRRAESLPAGGREASDPLPDQAAENAEIRDRLERALARLPEQRRTAFRLVEVEGMTTREVGRIMGIAPGTVRSHVHHARRHLRTALAEYADATEDARG
ncbi:MAG: sigma-70 family RNA polymerase sigma factor [Gemmatimonadales bacterium]|nr:MAG: sigma-70 family RNA polymerase sigma factor [Gemmatimonadales bacterium]